MKKLYNSPVSGSITCVLLSSSNTTGGSANWYMNYFHTSRTAVVAVFFLFCSFMAFAQPTVMQSSLFNTAANTTPNSSNARLALSTVGGFKQVRFLANTGGSFSWAFHQGSTGSPDYSTNWRPYDAAGAAGPIALNTYIQPSANINSARCNGGGGNDGTLPTITSGRYYTVNVTNNAGACAACTAAPASGGTCNSMQILETTFNPVALSSATVAQNPTGGNVLSSQSPVITVTTVSAPSAGENVFVRYTTNAFTSSTLVQLSFTGAVGTATIPTQSAGTVVAYYIFSSNKTLAQINSDVATNGQAAYDMATLNLNNNGGSNYNYTVTSNNILVTATSGTTSATYTTLALAINAINAGTHTGAIVCTVNDGYTETAPVGGYTLTQYTSNTSATPVIFQRSNTGGAKPILNAGVGTSTTTDAIFKLIGNDFITIDGFDMRESASNITTTTQVEWGVALLYTSLTNGAQNNTIQNCNITLNRTNLNTFGIYSNTRHSATAVTVSAEVTSAAGSNSNNKIYGNTISNVNFGIVFIGAGTTIAAIDTGNDIGGSSAGTGNTITNWGGGSAPGSYTSLTGNNYCIFINQQINDNVSFNTITSAALSQSVTAGGILKNYSVAAPTTGTISTTINNNTVQVTNNTTGTTTGGIIGINNQGLTPVLSTATMSMNNNTVQNCVLGGSTATTAGITGITNLSLPGTLNITGNNILSNSITATSVTTGSFVAISNTGAAGTVNINSNIIRGYTNNTSASYGAGSFLGISNSGAVVTALNINSNQIGNASGNAFSYSFSSSSAINNGIQNSAGASTCALSISNNSFQGFTMVTASAVSAILNTSGFVGGSISINNNTIGTATGGFLSFSAATSSSVTGISNAGGSSSSVLSMTGNDIRGIVHTIQGSSTHTYLSNSFATLSQNISSNTFTNLNVTTTGSVTFVSNAVNVPAAGSMNINSNSVVTAFNKGGAGGTVTFYSSNASSATGSVINFLNNNISNVTLTGATGFVGINNTDGGSPTKTITGNTFNNVSGGSGSINTMTVNFFGGTTSSVSSNTITNITWSAAITALTIGSSNNATTLSVNSNIINNISTTAGAVIGITSTAPATINMNSNLINTLSSTASATNIGLSYGGTATNCNISKNKIYDISGNNAGTVVNGIVVSAGTTVNVHNNLIGDLRASAATVTSPASAIIGINLTSTTVNSNLNVYYNTIYLNASSSGANFGTSGIFHAASATATTAALNLRNNVIINTSVANGTGLSVAYRRSAAATLGNYSATSNNNDFFGTSGLYTDGTTTNTTLAAYKTLMSTRDQASINESPTWQSTVGSSADFLKYNTSVASGLESGAVNISTYIDDNFGTVRFGNPSYVACTPTAGTAPDMGAWELCGTPLPSCTSTPTASTISGVAAVCAGSGTNLTLSPIYTDLGITYQWQSSTVTGGPYTNMGTASTQVTGNLTVSMYYICIITCTNSGLSYTTVEKSVLVNPLPSVTVTPSSASYCTPGGAAVSITATGGTNYAWGPAAGLNVTNVATVLASPSSTTTYTVTVTDANGCVNTATSIIALAANPQNVTATATPATICSGATSSLTGSATIPFTANQYVFTTSTGATLDAMTGASTIIGSPAVGSGVGDDTPSSTQTLGFTFNFEGVNYTQYSISPDGWILLGNSTATAQFINSTTNTTNIPKIYALWDDLCTGSNGNIKVLVTGVAPNRIFKAQWLVTNPRAIAGSANATYQIWLYESNNIIEYRYGTIGTSSSASAGITGSIATNFQSITLSANTVSTSIANDANTTAPASGRMYTFTPPSSGISYAWALGTNLVTPSAQNTLTTALSSTETFTLTATNAGCSSSAMTTVTVNPLNCSPATFSATRCAGSNFTVTANKSGGGAPFTYVWSDGSATVYPNTAIITANLPAGTYNFTCLVSDACGGSCNSNVTIVVNPLPTIAITPTPANALICGTGSVSMTASGGTGYAWTPTTFLTPSNGLSPTVVSAATITTSYTVTGTDANGCINTAMQIVTVAPAVTSPIATATPNPICAGSTLNLTSSAVISGYTMNGNSSVAFIDISATGTSVGTISDDSEHNLTIPSFNYNGVAYTTARVGNNGVLAFGSTSGDINYSNRALPAPLGANNTDQATGGLMTNVAGSTLTAICVNWDDMTPGTGGSIRTQTIGNKYIIQWTNEDSFDATGAGTITFQIQLDLTTGQIHLVYSDITYGAVGFDGGQSATIGLNFSSTNALQYSNLTLSLIDGQSVTFTPSTLTYAWTGPNGFTSSSQNPSIPNVTTAAGGGAYSVIASSSSGCTAQASTTNVTVNPNVTPTFSAVPAICAGESLSALPTTSNNGITGTWVPALENTTTTTYTFTPDGGQCATTATLTITVNPLPSTPTITGATSFCTGGSTTLTSSAASGNQWLLAGSPISGETGATLVVTAAGNYSVQVTDVNGCSATSGVTTITVNPLPSTPTITGATSFCTGGSTTLTSSAASGNQWLLAGSPISGETGATLVVTAAGNYSVQVTDVNGCSATSGVTTVTVNPLPSTPTITGATSFCTGGSTTLTSSAASGNQWLLAGSPISGETGATLVVTAAGNYSVQVTDVNGCSATSGVTTVTVNPLPSTPTITGATSFCAGGSTTLTSSAASGNQWLLAGSPISGETGATLVVTAAGNYSVQVTDVNGCSATSGVTTVTVNPLPSTPTITGATSFCTGGSTTLTSSAASGNQWLLAGSPISGETGATLVVTAAGNYSVQVTDVNDCSATSGVTTVTVNPLPSTPTITGATSFCTGGSTTLTSSAASGNQWLLAGNPISGETGATLVVTAAGNYSVQVTDVNGCSATSGVTTVTVNPLPSTPTITGATSFCAGGSTTLTSSAASGNQWLLAGSPISGETGATLVVTAAGNYSVQVTDVNGCSATSGVTTVTVNPLPSTPTITGATSFCTGGSTTLTSSAASGNQWLLAGSPISGETGVTLVVTAAGNYSVQVTDVNGCSATSGVTTVTVNPLPSTPTITGATSFCTGGSTTLTSSAASGNQWLLAGSPISGETGATLVVTAAGNYSVQVTDVNGCSATSGVTTVTVNPLPSTPTITGATSFCTGGSTTLTSSAASGNQWLLAGSPISGETGATLVVTAAGNYSVQVTDVNGCSATSGVTTVTVNPLPSTPTITGATSFCTGGSTTLTSSAASGNQWLLAGNPISGETGVTLVVTAAGNYSVQVTDVNGCSATSGVTTITVNPLPSTPTITGATSFCTGGSTTLTSSAASGNQWLLAGSPISGETGVTLVVTAAGNYSVQVTDVNGCSATSGVTTVTVNPLPSTPTITGATSFCTGGSTTLTSSAASGNQWLLAGSPISGETGATLVVTAAGNYSVQVTDVNGCSATSGVTTVTVNPLPSTPTITGATSFCTGGSTTLTSSAASGNQWLLAGNPISGETGATLVVTAAGNYSVQVTDVNGCSATSGVTTVTINPLPSTPTITGATSFCTSGSTTLTSSAASGNQWLLAGSPISGETNTTLVVSAAGAYSVRVTDGNSCSATSGVTTVTVNPLPSTPTITGATSFCAGGSTTLTSSAASGNQWLLAGSPISGETNTTLVVSAAGAYSVRVTDGNSCSATSGVTTVTVNPLPSTPTITGATSFCTGGSTTLTSSAASGNQWLLAGNPISGETGATLVVTAAGNYSVQVTDVNGCSATSGVTTVTVNPLPSTPTITGATSFCTGGSTTLTSSAASGNQWLLAGSPISGETGATLVVTAAGNYSVQVTDVNGCSATSGVTTVTVNPLPSTPTITGATSFCTGGSTTLTSSAASGNQWLLAGSPISGETGATLVVTAAGNYSVQVTDVNGCSATSGGTTVTVNPLPSTPTITGATSFCTGGSTTLTSSAASGNQWLLAGSPISGETGATLVVTAAGNYSVQVTDVNGCSATSGVTTVTVNPLPSTPTITGATSFCTGGSTTLTSSAASGNQWLLAGSPISGETGATLVVTAAGNYSVQVTDVNGCSATSGVTTVTVNPLPSTPTITGATSFCTGGSTTLTSSAASGNQWLLAGNPISGETSATLVVTAAGNYSVQVTDVNGCSATSGVTTVTEQAQPNAGTNGTLIICAGSTVTDSQLFAQLGGTPNAGGAWSPTLAGAGVYTYTVNATAPCTTAATATVTVTEQAQPNAGTNGTLTICAGSTVTASQLFAQLGGTPDVGGTWSPTLAGAGTYTYTVTATSPCTVNATATVIVTEQAQPTAGTNGTLIICAGSTVTTAQLFAQLGGSPNAGGTWSPTLAGAGVYTYTVNATAPCTTAATATVIVTEQAQPNAGTNGTLSICDGATVTAAQLFARLGGTPTAGGTWSPTLAGVGTYTYTVTATAPCTNATSTVIVTSIGSITPTFSVITTVCPGSTLSPLPTTSNNGIIGTWSPALNNAMTTTYTFTPNVGQCAATTTLTITVGDTQPPSITCPSNIIRGTDLNLCSAIVNYATPISSDNCGSSVAIVSPSLTSGSSFPKGTSTVIWRAIDGAGLTATCSFNVTVNDVQKPTITCPPNRTQATDPNLCSALVTYPTPTVTDNCTPNATVAPVSGGTGVLQGSPNSSATFDKGINIVIWKATDAVGNTQTCSFRVTISDLQAPTLTCLPNVSVNTGTNTCSAVVPYTLPTFTDNCPLFSSQSVRISGLLSGSMFPVGTNNIVYRATDAAGNTKQCTLRIIVTDNQPPSITCPPSVVVTGSGTPCVKVVFYASPTASDNCAGTLTPFLFSGFASGSIYPAGVTTNTWRAVAPNGQSSTCTFTVIVDCGSGMSGNSVLENRDEHTDITGNTLEQANKLDLRLAPNPARSSVTVSMEGMNDNGGILSVFDPMGRLVLQQVLKSDQQTTTFNLENSEFAPGLYLVNLRTEKGMVTKTLVVYKL